ncbi:MAG: urocanate hydratase [Acidobacteriota bacterium]|nr:urocanate hydratase [Acidobacteriota bacterium]
MSSERERFRRQVREGIPERLPDPPPDDPGVDHAPPREPGLSRDERALALANALRYFPERWHGELAPEFAEELLTDGHVYMRRFRPRYSMRARPAGEYPCRTTHAAAIMLMIQNNLDPAVAQFPHELITYGGNGAVFQNWAQYLLTMRYLSEMTDRQTLVLYSGHPLGLFPSHEDAPRVVVTNGMVVPRYSSTEEFERLNALGVTSYGQMTAGSFMYIGPQGIVHGTTITLLGAGRLYGKQGTSALAGRVFVTSGLGGMSGAQAKAAVIAGGIGVVAEVNPAALEKRHAQGWVMEKETDLDRLLERIDGARRAQRPLSIGFLGNVVDLWERLDRERFDVDLGSDQTSLHNPYHGGYYPAGLGIEDARVVMKQNPQRFRELVHESLRRQVAAINGVASRGMAFWDYGNAFLIQARRAGADIDGPDGSFRYPSYVEDIMGPSCFDYGFGPFRWVCASGKHADLVETDRIAAQVLEEQAASAPERVRQQTLDNLRWIRQAEDNQLVVGSQARILYADHDGRRSIAAAFNGAVREGRVDGPIVLGRDHHDVGGTDSPWRETANVRDGSRFTADMAVHGFVGDAFRGATWVSLHNGGGVGWGEVINGGFGMVLDGSEAAGRRAHSMLSWDVVNGLARRAWARNEGAVYAVARAAEAEPDLRVTLPATASREIVENALSAAEASGSGR